MTEQRTIARVYARAAYKVAEDSSLVAAWEQALIVLSKALSDVRIKDLVAMPLTDLKANNFDLVNFLFELCGEALLLQQMKLPASFRNFLKLLRESKRMNIVTDIQQLFSEIVAAQKRSLQATVSSAFSLSDPHKKELQRALEARFQKQIICNYQLNPKLIGGAHIKVGDTVIDGSLLSRLTRLIAVAAV